MKSPSRDAKSLFSLRGDWADGDDCDDDADDCE